MFTSSFIFHLRLQGSPMYIILCTYRHSYVRMTGKTLNVTGFWKTYYTQVDKVTLVKSDISVRDIYIKLVEDLQKYFWLACMF